MNINERIKLVRKQSKMTQTDFGARIAVTQNHLSSIENGYREATEKVIKIICFEFNVNESWLRTGEGEMFTQQKAYTLDEFAQKNHLTELETEIMKCYMELDPDVRKQLMTHFKARFGVRNEEVSATIETKLTPEQAMDKEVENYRQELIAEEKAKTSLVSEKQDKKSS